MTQPNIEIKRRFVITDNAWQMYCNTRDKRQIRLGYPDKLSKDEDLFGRVRSTRSTSGKHIYDKTFKSKQVDLQVEEFKTEITQVEFDRLMRAAAPNWLDKWRTEFVVDDRTYQVDQFTSIRSRRSTLTIIQTHFDRVADAHAFNPPSWLGREVTKLHQWSNFSLCHDGVPELAL